MKIIPLINIKKRKIVKLNYKNFENINVLLENYKDEYLYILDHDGILKNRPNLCAFQKLSKNHELWVDTGPRVIGDIVDSVIAGASIITIRKELINLNESSNINEILENDIYLNTSYFQKSGEDNKIELDFLLPFSDQNKDALNLGDSNFDLNSIKNNNAFVYLPSKDDIQKIKKFDVEGYIIDIENIEEFKKFGI
jgi:uncharacterized protein related to proFAR isomerase